MSEPTAGRAWRPVEQMCGAQCADEALAVTLDALHPADGGAVIRDFGLHAVFDLADGTSARFIAWQVGGSGFLRTESAGTRFMAGRASLRRLEVEYLWDGIDRTEALGLAGADTALLSPGHYLLVGPRADGAPADIRGWTHSGDASRPLGGAVDVDVLAFRVESPA
ncbi:MAG: hypothetical protein ACK5PG_16400 [Lysobacterales bacterium]